MVVPNRKVDVVPNVPDDENDPMKIVLEHHHYFHNVQTNEGTQILEKLGVISTQLTSIGKVLTTMNAREQQLLTLIQKVDATTTEEGTVLEAEATSLTNISDAMDKLLAEQAAGSISQETLDAAQVAADHADAISTSLKATADRMTAIAAKVPATPADPVPEPTPVPPPTPVPEP